MVSLYGRLYFCFIVSIVLSSINAPSSAMGLIKLSSLSPFRIHLECYGVVRGRPSVKMWLARNVTFFVTNMWRTSLWRFFVTDMWRASLWHFVWRICDGCHVWRDRDGHVTDSCPVHYMSFRSGYDIPALSIQSAGHGVLGCWVALGFDSSVRRLVLFLSQGRFVSPERWRRVALLSPALQSEFSCRYHYFFGDS